MSARELARVRRLLLLFTPGAPREPYFEGLADLGRMEADERDAFLRAHDNLLVEP